MSLNYYVNAFTKNSKQPKILDGKMNTSLGGQVNQLKEFVTPDKYSIFYNQATGGFDVPVEARAETQHNTTYVFLTPSLFCPVHAKTLSDTTQSKVIPGTEDATEVVIDLDPDHMFMINKKVCIYNKNALLSTTDTAVMSRQQGPEQWRLVSNALRIYAIESRNNTKGYYEAVCMPLPVDCDQYEFREELKGGVSFTDRMVSRLESKWVTLRDDASYNSGTIHTLGSKFFQCPVDNPDHTPAKLASSLKYEFNSATDMTLKLNSLNNVRSLNSIFDQNHLMWVIRIRTDKKFSMNMNYKLNFECNYPISDSLNAFETLNFQNILMSQLFAKIQRNNMQPQEFADMVSNHLPANQIVRYTRTAKPYFFIENLPATGPDGRVIETSPGIEVKGTIESIDDLQDLVGSHLNKIIEQGGSTDDFQKDQFFKFLFDVEILPDYGFWDRSSTFLGPKPSNLPKKAANIGQMETMMETIQKHLLDASSITSEKTRRLAITAAAQKKMDKFHAGVRSIESVPEDEEQQLAILEKKTSKNSSSLVNESIRSRESNARSMKSVHFDKESNIDVSMLSTTEFDSVVNPNTYERPIEHMHIEDSESRVLNDAGEQEAEEAASLAEEVSRSSASSDTLQMNDLDRKLKAASNRKSSTISIGSRSRDSEKLVELKLPSNVAFLSAEGEEIEPIPVSDDIEAQMEPLNKSLKFLKDPLVSSTDPFTSFSVLSDEVEEDERKPAARSFLSQNRSSGSARSTRSREETSEELEGAIAHLNSFYEIRKRSAATLRRSRAIAEARNLSIMSTDTSKYTVKSTKKKRHKND